MAGRVLLFKLRSLVGFHWQEGGFRGQKAESVANRTASSNLVLSAIQSAFVILYIAFRSKYRFSRAKCGDLHL
jgi:hypothetical protein